MRYFLLLIYILIAFSACKRPDYCSEADGQEIRCYAKDNDPGSILYEEVFSAIYCTKKDQPPCDCADENLVVRDVATLFEQPCSGSLIGGPSGAGRGLINEPYDFTCVPGFSGMCPEYNLVYIDVSNTSLDKQGRFGYFNFVSPNFDLTNFSYRFDVVGPYSGTNPRMIVMQNLTRENMGALLVSVNPAEGCPEGKVCDLSGVVRLDLSQITSPGEYKVELIRVERGTGRIIGAVQGKFNVEFQDGSSTRRILNFVTYKGSTDISNYSLGERNWSNGLVQHVFGLSKSNILMNSYTAPLSGQFITTQSYLKLDSKAFTTGNLETDIILALHDWTQRVHEQIPPANLNYQGFLFEAYSVQKWNLATQELISIGSANDVANQMGFSGITPHAKPIGWPQTQFREGDWIGAIVFRKKAEIKKQLLGLSDQQITLNELMLYLALHEMGHMWSPGAGYMPDGSSGCDGHVLHCNGKNKYRCFWQLACILENDNPVFGSNESQYILQMKKDPVFCEGHQQYFMNRLRVR